MSNQLNNSGSKANVRRLESAKDEAKIRSEMKQPSTAAKIGAHLLDKFLQDPANNGNLSARNRSHSAN